MRFSSKRFCLLLLCAAMCLAVFPFRADALTEDVRLTYGTNVEAQNYNNSNYSKPVLSYLTETADEELMRVQADAYGGRYYVEYYDGTYRLLRSLAVEAELPLFGAFYATESNYYVLSGQENPEESPAVECFRITKYDLNWKRINSVGVYDCNTTIPFRAGSARMDHSGNMLAIRTCHQMYTHTDGLRHQANVTILVDTDTMTVTDAATEVLGYSVGYVSHSFNQFIRVEDDRVVAVDHGDAYPRAIVLSRSPALVSGGKFSYWDGESFELRPFGGEVGDNVTGASVGAFEISDSSYLVAYCSHPPMSIVMDYQRDVFVAAMDKQSGEVTIRQFTVTAFDNTAGTPHLTKVGEDSFLLLWSSEGNVYYTLLNGKGEGVSRTYCMENAALSDCAPIAVGGKVVWYTYRNASVTFYEIDAADPSETRRISSYAVGDVSNNGDIDGADYLLLKRYCLGTFPLTEEQLAAADVNQDGAINAFDYALVKRHVLGTYVIG